MSNLFNEPRTQFIGDDGLPLINGTVTFYAAGTTTLLDTYVDAKSNVKNTNPVVLDEQGRADIWLTPETYYKMVLKNSAGTTLKTDDNVLGTRLAVADSSTLAADLTVNGKSFISSSSSDLNIYLTPNGSGRTVITNAALQNNLDGAGYKLLFSSGSGFSAVTTGNKLLYFTTVNGATTYLRIKNAATAGNVIMAPVGNTVNMGLTLKPKGTGTVNVSGTANYETNIVNLGPTSNPCAIVTKKYMDDRCTKASGSTTPTSATSCTWSASGTALTLGAAYNVTSISDTGVGDATVNFTSAYGSANYYVVGGHILYISAVSNRYARVTTLGTSSLRYKTYVSTTDAAGDLTASTRGGIFLIGSLT